jgi:hypothetical protein
VPAPKTIELRPPTRRGGPDPIAKRFNRNLAICAREAVPAEIMCEYLLAIMEGHGQAVLKRAGGEWIVTWPGGPTREDEGTGELQSTHEQKAWAWLQWRQAGYGMPAQSIQLEGELRTMQTTRTTIELAGRTPAEVMALRAAIRLALAPPPAPADPVEVPTSEPQAIDAEFSEVPAASSDERTGSTS